MTLTGHWNRAWERPFHCETREELVREEQKWENALDRYQDAVSTYVQSGGKIIIDRLLAFRCIVRLNLMELRDSRETRDILGGIPTSRGDEK